MRRSMLLASAFLATLIAVALLGAAAAVRPPGLPAETDGPREAVNRALALRFYDAANAAIETGDLTPLTPLVAPELLDDALLAPDESGSITLGRRLRSLHATSPALRLAVEALAVDGDLVIAHVRAERPGVPAFLGLRLTEAPEPWGPIDILRIASDRVVEYRAPVAGSGLLEPAMARSRDLPPHVRLLVTARRISLAAATRHDGAAASWFRLLYVERGTVTVTIAETASDPASTVALRPAGHAMVPSGVVYTIQNKGNAPASLLELRADRVIGSTPVADPSPAAEGVVVSGVGNFHLSGTASGEVVLSFGRATLAPGARLAWSDGAGPVLLCVEAGTARLDVDPDVPWIHDGTTLRSVPLGDLSLAADSSVIVPAGHAVALTAAADAPTTLLIVTLLPVDVLSATDVPRG